MLLFMQTTTTINFISAKNIDYCSVLFRFLQAEENKEINHKKPFVNSSVLILPRYFAQCCQSGLTFRVGFEPG